MRVAGATVYQLKVTTLTSTWATIRTFVVLELHGQSNPGPNMNQAYMYTCFIMYVLVHVHVVKLCYASFKCIRLDINYMITLLTAGKLIDGKRMMR